MKCDRNLKCILKCAFGISCLEMEVYLTLLKSPELDVSTIAEKLGKDNSSVYKALKNLMDRGLVKREYRILRGGGYKYVYKAVDFDKFKEITVRMLKRWLDDIKNSKI